MVILYDAHSGPKKMPLRVVLEYSESIKSACCVHYYGDVNPRKEVMWFAPEDEWRNMLLAHIMQVESEWGALIRTSGDPFVMSTETPPLEKSV